MPLSRIGWRRGAAWTAALWFSATLVCLGGVQVYVLEPTKPDEAHDLILVEKESAKDGTVLLTEPGGTEKKVSKDRIVARLMPAPGRGQKVDRATAVRAINALLEAKAKAAALERTLQEEVEKWKKILDQMPSEEDPEALAKAEAAFSAAMTKALPKSYDPAAAYSKEDLATRVLALEELKREFPSRGAEIEKQAEPWKVEQAEMAAGKRKLEGRWLEPQEWEKKKGRAKRRHEMRFSPNWKSRKFRRC